MSDRLTALDVFVRAIRLGGMSAAARTLGISATMAARHLTGLEDRLGVKLVHRTTRRLSLTVAGEGFLERAERLLLDLREAEAEASARTTALEGLLRVSAPTVFGLLHLVPLVSDFAQLHPGITLELGLIDRHVDLLQERWDVAIRIGHLASSGLAARRLAPASLTICGSPAYLAAHGTPHALRELSAHECLGFTLPSLIRPDIWAFGTQGQIKIPVRASFRSDNGQALIQAAVADRGLVYGPRFQAAAHIADGSLVEIDLGVPLMEMGAIHIVTLSTRQPAEKVRAFSEFIDMRIRHLSADW